MYTMSTINKYILLCTGASLLAACTPTVAQRGNLLEERQVSQIVPTIHTQSDVLRILGSPTTIAPFDESTWYYIGQETEKHGILDPEIVQERIVVVHFDEEGIVSHIETPQNMRIAVPIERSKTPTHGNEVTAVQQLLGNLGKFNPQGNE